MHTSISFSRTGLVCSILAISVAPCGFGQAAALAPAAAPLPSAMLQPALSDVQGSTSALVISRWKAPAEVRQEAQANVDSIQRDLGTTLPGLLTQADAAPASVPPSFAVYRNLDALYDVLLRVSSTASLAAPRAEADAIGDALRRLEAARTQLAQAILQTSQNRETQIVQLQAAVKAAKAAPPVVAHTTVVDDGPAKTTTRKTHHRTTPAKPAAKTTTSSTTQKPTAATPAANSSN